MTPVYLAFDQHDISYVDYHRCINAKGEDFVPCKQFFRAYNSLCPNEWVSIILNRSRQQRNDDSCNLKAPAFNTGISTGNNTI